MVFTQTKTSKNHSNEWVQVRYGRSRAKRTTWQWVQFKHGTNPTQERLLGANLIPNNELTRSILQLTIYHSQQEILRPKTPKKRMLHDPWPMKETRAGHDKYQEKHPLQSDSPGDAPGLAVASEWNLHQRLGHTWDSPATVPMLKNVPKKNGRNVQKRLTKYQNIYQNIIKCTERVDFYILPYHQSHKKLHKKVNIRGLPWILWPFGPPVHLNV